LLIKYKKFQENPHKFQPKTMNSIKNVSKSSTKYNKILSSNNRWEKNTFKKYKGSFSKWKTIIFSNSKK